MIIVRASQTLLEDNASSKIREIWHSPHHLWQGQGKGGAFPAFCQYSRESYLSTSESGVNGPGGKRAGHNLGKNDIDLGHDKTEQHHLGPRWQKIQLPVDLEPYYTLIVIHWQKRSDGGAWWAAVYGVAQSRTQLKRLGSSSSTAFYRWYKQSAQDIESHEFNHPNNGIPSRTFLSMLIYLLSQNLITTC